MMKQTIARAWGLYRRHWGALMLMLLVELVLRLMAATPLLFLAAGETRALALLCVPLWMLIVLPARQNAAQVMAELQAGEPLRLTELVSGRDYGRKLCRGLKQTGLLLLWALPFLCATAFALYVFKGETVAGVTDSFSLLRTFIDLGNSRVVRVLLPISESATIRGVGAVAVLYLLTLTPVFFGQAFHSGTRHAFALGRGPKALKRRRGGVICTWLVGLLTLVPFALVAAKVSTGYLSALMSAVASMGSAPLPAPDQKVWIIALAFVALCLPLVPLKQLITACRVRLALDKQPGAAA